MKKINSDSPSLEAMNGIPVLYLKQGSRYRRATSQEILSATVLLLAHNGKGSAAFQLQVALGQDPNGGIGLR